MIKPFTTCHYCKTTQRTNPEHPLYSVCDAPIQALFKSNFFTLQSLSDDWCTHVIDVSKWQGNIHSETYKSSDSKYLIIKASQGNWGDSKYQQNVDMCIENEFAFGLYHFMDTRVPADDAAKFFADQVNELPGEISEDGFSKVLEFGLIRFWLDVEATFGKSHNEMRNYIRDFLRIFEIRTGLKLGIYTRGYFWNDYVAQMDEVHEHPLWVAHYNSWNAEPFIPEDWSRFGVTWELWQYSADGNGEGEDYGAESHSIDKNRFNGDCSEFEMKFIGDGEIVEPPPPPPPEPSECLQLEVINTNALRVRSEPSTSGGNATVLYTLELGSHVDVLDIVPITNETWIEIKPGEFSAMFYNGFYYLKKKNK